MEWTHTSNADWAESLRRTWDAMEEAARRPLPPFRPFRPFRPFSPISPPAPPQTPSPTSAPDPGPPPDLKEGDEVEVRFGRERVRCLVAGGTYVLAVRRGRWTVLLRRKGFDGAGKRFPVFRRPAAEARLVRKYDPVRGNIYADYLEEHGFAEAADALRAAFPLAGGEGPG
jgi:hypothetical protein